MNSKLMAGILFLATLVFGMFAGVVLDRTVLRPQPPFPGIRTPMGPPEVSSPRMQMFSKKLQLNSEQEHQLQEILESYRVRFGNLRHNLHPRYMALRDSLNTDIRAMLTPEQQEKLETMLHEFNPGRRWKYDHGRGDRPPMPDME